jgi:hypothetical protein
MTTRIGPKAGEESDWNYPCPPRLEKAAARSRVVFGGKIRFRGSTRKS